MSNSVSETLYHLVQQTYQPDAPLEKQVGDLLVAVLPHTHWRWVSVAADELGTVVADASHDNCKIFARDNAGETHGFNGSRPHLTRANELRVNGATTAECTASQNYSLTYSELDLGRLAVPADKGEPADQSGKQLAHQLARELTYMIMRQCVRRRTRHQFNKEVALTGVSPSLRSMEIMVEKAAHSSLPVVINGEPGSEFAHVVCAIHFSSLRAKQPFIEVNCAAQNTDTMESDPAQWLRRARGGTLFLNRIDLLDIEIQNRLSALLEPRSLQWLGPQAGADTSQVKLIASATDDLSTLVRQKKFAHHLYAELDFLRIHLPPLRERADDVPALAAHFLGHYSQDPHIHLTERAQQTLAAYRWPGNFTELQHVMARLATMSDERKICLSHIEDIAPHCLPPVTRNANAHLAAGQNVATNRTGQCAETAKSDGPAASPPKSDTLAVKLLADEFNRLDTLHPSLQKALKYIRDHYQEDTTLSELASHACVSSSHLCYLFRSELGTTFKSLLGSIRIEQAKRLLATNSGTAITTVSLDVGFRDLSHFERTFRRLVGLNPREYKRQSSHKNGCVDQI